MAVRCSTGPATTLVAVETDWAFGLHWHEPLV